MSRYDDFDLDLQNTKVSVGDITPDSMAWTVKTLLICLPTALFDCNDPGPSSECTPNCNVTLTLEYCPYNE